MKNIPCFIMICTNRTEEECLKKGLFGGPEWRLPFLKFIKKGDIGFLYNLTSDELIGIFRAKGPAQLNIDPKAWGGRFPAQIKVTLLGELQRIKNAKEKLKNIIEFQKYQDTPHEFPKYNTYNPEITEKILSLFKIPDVLKEVQPTESDLLLTEIPEEYTLENVAGLEDVKNFIRQRILASFEDEKTQKIAYRLKLKVSAGILLVGPPGTGKTLISQTIAKCLNARFIEISPSVIIGYPGEAEQRLEKIFATLDNEPRAVIFLDEAEWILCRRKNLTSSVMQRITPLLLMQLSKIFKEKTKLIIIIAATNKPERIDEAFLRPGRFDRIFYIPLPDKNVRKEIIKLQLRDRANQLSEDDITEIAEELDGYSGADIEKIINESAYIAFERFCRKKEEVFITKEDIKEVIAKTPKSVPREEIEKIEEWVKNKGIKYINFNK